jgi:putative sterol carrier protein
MATFPTEQWLRALMEKLNNDEHYAQIARNWEGDMLIIIEPSGVMDQERQWYLDLWHGKCRDAYALDDPKSVQPSVTLRGPYDTFLGIFRGEMDTLQALWTRKIGVQGNMALLMRSVPTVLEFVRCCREITDSYV